MGVAKVGLGRAPKELEGGAGGGGLRPLAPGLEGGVPPVAAVDEDFESGLIPDWVMMNRNR